MVKKCSIYGKKSSMYYEDEIHEIREDEQIIRIFVIGL